MTTGTLPKFIALIALLAAAGAALLLLSGAPAPAPAAAQTDYDRNNNGLIEIHNLAQLNAVRHDLDGNGDPASSTPYDAAFPDRDTEPATRMGLPLGQLPRLRTDGRPHLPHQHRPLQPLDARRPRFQQPLPRHL